MRLFVPSLAMHHANPTTHDSFALHACKSIKQKVIKGLIDHRTNDPTADYPTKYGYKETGICGENASRRL